MSDSRFSIDDILNEHPKRGEPNAQSGSFDLDALLKQKPDYSRLGLENEPKTSAKPAPLSPIAAELNELKDTEMPELPAKAKPQKPDGSVNIVLSQKKPAPLSREKFVATMELDFDEKIGESNAFEAIESFTDSRTARIPLKEKRLQKKNEKKLRRLEAKAKAEAQFAHESHEEDSEEISLHRESQTTASEPIPVPKHELKRDKPRKVNKEELPEKMSFEDKSIRPIQSSISGNTEIIDSLIRIKRERVAQTQHINAISRKSIADIDLNLEDKILPDTAQIPIDKNADELAKLKELGERRKKKIRDFVLVGDDEEEEADDLADIPDDRQISDFESFEDAPSILQDIRQLKGSLAVRLLFLIFTAIASVYINLANDLSLPLPDILNASIQPTSYLFVNIVIGLLSAFVSYTALSCGITKLFKLQADCDSLCALAVVSSILSATLCFASPALIQQGTVRIYISAAIVCLLFNTIGKLTIVGRTARNFQYISGDYDRYAVFTLQDEEKASLFTRGTMSDFPVLASMRKTEFITDFLKNSYAPDITDKFCLIAGPILLVGSVLMGVLSGFLHRNASGGGYIYIGAAAFAGCIALCSCFAIILVINLPMKKATAKYLEHSAVMLSYQGVEDFADTNSVLVDVTQLFPQGMINLSAIKIFSDTRIDEAIVEAASLTSQAGSILKHMFYDIIAGKTEMLNPVESYIYEDSMGLCGWINNKRVLLGNRELMDNHSIGGLPTKEREKEYTESGKVAVYLSISGELSAMFVIEIKPNLEVRRWLKELERNEVYVILRTVDSVISINRLAELFDISPDMLKLLPFRLHPNFEEETSYVPRQSASLACAGRFQSFASLIVGAKRIRRTAALGLCIQSAGAILGFVLALILTLLSSFDQLSPTFALLYNLGWAALTLLAQSFRKT